MSKILTIAIPLYKEIFLDRLALIIPQLTAEVHLLIMNDNLSLDIQKKIYDRYGSLKNLEIINNTVNLGLGTNLSNCFYYTRTKWMWLLGDDDIVLNNSVELILNKIKKTENALLKFSYIHQKSSGNEYSNYHNDEIKGIEELIDYLYSKKNEFDIGNMIFMSNSVFNMEKLKNYVDTTYKNTYCYAPHFALILSYLSENKSEKIELCTEQIVINYYPNIEEKWTRFIVALGILNMQYMILDINAKSHKKLIDILYNFINFRFIFLELFIEGIQQKDFQKSKFIYKQLYKNGLAKTDFFIEKILYKVLYFIMDKPFIVFKVFDILKKINSKYDVNLRVRAKGFNKKI